MEESLELKEIRWRTDFPQPLTFFMMMNTWMVRIKRKYFWNFVLEKGWLRNGEENGFLAGWLSAQECECVWVEGVRRSASVEL